jgi:hypothetical protein
MAAEKKYQKKSPGIKALTGVFLTRSDHGLGDAVSIGLSSGETDKVAGHISITKAKNQPPH